MRRRSRAAAGRALRYAVIRYGFAGLFGTIAGLSLTAIEYGERHQCRRPLHPVQRRRRGDWRVQPDRRVVVAGGVVAGAVVLSLIGALLGALNVSTDYNAAVQGLLLLGMLGLRATLFGRRGPRWTGLSANSWRTGPA